MEQYVAVPPQRLDADVLQALLQEYASRDGTDYCEREASLAEKVTQLRAQLDRGEIAILFATESETWDLLPREQADLLLNC